MQDFSGVPSLVDLAAMRSVIAKRGGASGQDQSQMPVDCG